jgi:hypothetical protein
MGIGAKKIFINFRDSFLESRSFVLNDEKMVDEYRCIFIFEDRRFFSCCVNQMFKICKLLIFFAIKEKTCGISIGFN